MKQANRKIVARGAALALAATACQVALSDSAHADVSYPIAWTGIGIFPRTTPSMSAAQAGGAISDGTSVQITCETTGEPVSNGTSTSTIWEKLSDGSYIPNAFVNTGVDGWTPGVPRCDNKYAESWKDPGRFYRNAAANWALDNVNAPPSYEQDCTYFVSSALWKGDMPWEVEWNPAPLSDSNWPHRPRAAINAQSFVDFFRSRPDLGVVSDLKWAENRLPGALLGDVIAYDWQDDGEIDHLAIITAFNLDGYPFVTQHTSAQKNRFWSWDSSGGDWIENTLPKARAYLIHITY